MPTPTIFEGINPRGTQTLIPCKDVSAFPRSEQAVLGAKNFLKYPYYHTTRTQNNVTFTDNGDGSITIETTDAGASENTAFIMMNESACKSYFSDFIGRTFKISGGTSSVEVGEQSLQVEGVGNYSTGDDLEVTVRNDLANAGSVLAIKLLVRSGKKITTPITVRPMLSFDGGEYVPSAMTNKELTERFAKVPFTIPSTTGSVVKLADYPRGFNNSNAVILNFAIDGRVGIGQFGTTYNRCFMQLASNEIQIFNGESGNVGKTGYLILGKL